MYPFIVLCRQIICVPLYLSLSFCVYVCGCMCAYLSLSVFNFLSMFTCVPLYLSLSFCVCVCGCVCGCMCAYLSLSLFNFLSMFTCVCLSPWLSHARFVFPALSRPTCSVSTRIHANSHLRQHLHYTIQSHHTNVLIMSQYVRVRGSTVRTAACGNTCIVRLSHVTCTYQSCHTSV